MFKTKIIRRKTYFCSKCKHIHLFESKIGKKHRKYNDKFESELEVKF